MSSAIHSSAVEANEALGRQFFAEQDRLRGGPAPQLCAAAYTATIGSNPPTDRAGHEAFAVAFYAAFPDVSHHAEEVLADEDRVFVRAVLRGTNTGSFFGMPATGKPIAVAIHAILFVADGVVQKLVAVFDEAGMLRQVGAMQ